MVTALDHLEIIVNDLEPAVAFFQKLGLVLRRRTEHHGGSAELVVPGSDGCVIELHRVGAEENPGLNHVAFRCDDVEREYESLVAAGLAFEENPPGWGKPFRVTETNRIVANLRTPDGFRIQLTSGPRERT